MSERLEVLFPGGKRVDVRFGDFTVETDQSPKHGGAGSAPEPFMLFLSSIAACAGIYALGFCQSRDLPTEGLGLAMNWEPASGGSQAKATLELTLPPGFPEKHHPSIMKAIDLCAVKKAILNAPEFSTVIAG